MKTSSKEWLDLGKLKTWGYHGGRSFSWFLESLTSLWVVGVSWKSALTNSCKKCTRVFETITGREMSFLKVEIQIPQVLSVFISQALLSGVLNIGLFRAVFSVKDRKEGILRIFCLCWTLKWEMQRHSQTGRARQPHAVHVWGHYRVCCSHLFAIWSKLTFPKVRRPSSHLYLAMLLFETVVSKQNSVALNLFLI